MHFMLETIVVADLMGINAFNQPAVEESKAMTKRYLISGDY
jgi:glucose-6-phosphate isomerase